jgi:hypothetical protein
MRVCFMYSCIYVLSEWSVAMSVLSPSPYTHTRSEEIAIKQLKGSHNPNPKHSAHARIVDLSRSKGKKVCVCVCVCSAHVCSILSSPLGIIVYPSI